MLGDLRGELKEVRLCPELDAVRRWGNSIIGHLNKWSLSGGQTRAR